MAHCGPIQPYPFYDSLKSVALQSNSPSSHGGLRAEQCELRLSGEFSLRGSVRATIWDRRSAYFNIYKKNVSIFRLI